MCPAPAGGRHGMYIHVFIYVLDVADMVYVCTYTQRYVLDVSSTMSAAARRARAVVTAAAQGRPYAWPELGLPKWSPVYGSISAVTSGKIGDVAFQSRYMQSPCTCATGERVSRGVGRGRHVQHLATHPW